MLSMLLCTRSHAAITLPKVIGNNMVLQRNQPVRIWGEAAAGERINVTFNMQHKATAANADGKWMITLEKMVASDKPAEMTISGTNTIVLANILVGEVWLCSGQSNMEYTMTKSSKYAHALRSSGISEEELKQEKNGNIRLFLVKRDLSKPADINKGWEVAEGTAVGTFQSAGRQILRNNCSKRKNMQKRVYDINAHNLRLKINKRDGTLMQVQNGRGAIPFNNGPVLQEAINNFSYW